MAIKEQYQLKRNWQGDPCFPKEYAWDGLNCSRTHSPPRIVFINLSSSALTGEISHYFAPLDATEYLDLSYNNLTGIVPDFLGNLMQLKVLNLTGNNFTGPIPSTLLKRSEEGSLILKFTNKTIRSKVASRRKKISTPIVVLISVVPAVILLLLLSLFIIWLRRRRKVMAPVSVIPHTEGNLVRRTEHEQRPLQVDSWHFSYIHLERITNNFARVIGKGAFGTVYLGYLENGTPVAVKVHSPSTSQWTQEFVVEAKNLTNIHHRNLVSLLGYCSEGNHLALVYEYMPQGSLKEHLQARGSLSGTLSWRDRPRIALDAAYGLEYLHQGCLPSIIHRDLKSSNILLGEKLEAKLTDYGLSKSFSSNADVTLMDMAGTPGYIDPEFHTTYQLSEKSDIYSFGVVLLELITGQRAIQPGRRKVHIVQLVAPHYASGDIAGIPDQRLEGSYSSNSLWKATDLAMKCTADVSAYRPTVVDVVMQLKECLQLEIAADDGTNHSETAIDSQITAFEIH